MKYGNSMFRQVSFILAFCGVLLLGSRQSMALIEIDAEINDPAFSNACAEALLKNLGA